ncbi:MAG: hypothetical protein LBK47_07910 [Prevotellaceae bacterium]|jgi:hypothetical protein|nr:hypothetical protein [Prevotellaceae bacterium]
MGNNMGGRPKKIDKLGVWLTIRLTEEEDVQLRKLMADHSLTSRTKFVKACIFSGKIKFVAVDNSSLEANARLADITQQLRAIGVNHNQAVKHLNTVFGEIKAANIVKHMAANYSKVDKVLEELKLTAEDIRKKVYNINQ